MIPGYRIRIYCFMGAAFCLSCAWLMGAELYDALTLFQFDALTGTRGQKVKELLVFADQPWRFLWYVLETTAIFIFSGCAGLAMTWGALRGRRAFKRWHSKF